MMVIQGCRGEILRQRTIRARIIGQLSSSWRIRHDILEFTNHRLLITPSLLFAIQTHW